MTSQNNIKQTGRSMIEMLAVLAIIGVLSITALAGFTFAMNKYRANETIYEVMLRATNVPMIDEYYASKPAGYEFTFSDLGSNDGTQGSYYAIHTYKDSGSAYRIEVLDVSDNICKQILRMTSMDVDKITVGTTSFSGDDSICSANTNKITFYFGLSDCSGSCDPDDGSDDTPEDPCAGKNCGNGATCIDGTCVSCTDGSVCNCISGTWNEAANLCCEEVTEPADNVCFSAVFTPASIGQCPSYTLTYLTALCGTNGYCLESACIECNEGENATETGCEPILCEETLLETTTEYCCTSYGGLWDTQTNTCGCSDGYIFDAETNTCVESDGQCSYSYNDPNGVQVSHADCSYTGGDVTGFQETYADCIYTNAQPADKTNLSMSAQQACPAGQYCYLKWTTDNCSTETESTGASTLYGRCLPLDSTEAYCRERLSGHLNMIATKSCPAGQYCYLKWTTDDCSSEAESTGAPTLYGRCLPIDSVNGICKQTYTAKLELTAIKSCPSDQYCYLKWAGENCTSTVETFAGANPFYGVCLSLDSVNAVCP